MRICGSVKRKEKQFSFCRIDFIQGKKMVIRQSSGKKAEEASMLDQWTYIEFGIG